MPVGKKQAVQIQQTTKQPVQQTTKQPVQQTTKQPVQQTTKQPAQQTIKQPVQQTTKQPAQQTTKQAVCQDTQQAVCQDIKQAVQQQNIVSYDTINSWELLNKRYLFFDIFAVNNEIILICPYYYDNPNELNIEILCENKQIEQTDRLEFCEPNEPIIILKYAANINCNKEIDIFVKYDNNLQKYTLYHKVISKMYKCMAGTLFLSDYYSIPTFVTYYTKHGVQYFVLYYNGTVTDELRQSVAKFSNVLLLEWNYMYWLTSAPHHHAQLGQINHLLYKYGKPYAEWIASMDLDEYFVPNNKERLLKDLFTTQNDHVMFQNYWAHLENNEIPEQNEAIDFATKQIYVADVTLAGRTKIIARPDKVNALGVHFVKRMPRGNIVKNWKMLHFLNWSQPNRKIESDFKLFEQF